MPGAVVFTAKGLEKLRASVAAAVQGAQRALAPEMFIMREEAARLAPPPAVEARLLSEGVATSGARTLRVVGTPYGGRFLRESGMVSLQEAIRTEPIVQKVQFGTRVIAEACSATRINARTGFSWNTRKRGIQGPTLPFNRAYVQAVENGGVVWYVRPRPGTIALEPEPGVFAGSMAKTMRPYRMFATARAQARTGMRRRVGRVIRAEVQRVGLA